jgi:acetyl-CoA synthetase
LGALHNDPKFARTGEVVLRPSVIRKGSAANRVTPNWTDYDGLRATFSWEAARRELAGLPQGGLNIAHEAVDRHASGAARGKPAFRCLGAERSHDLSYLELSLLTNRFANVLRTLGVGKGERVFVLAGRIPELYIAVLGSSKNGCVACPLFSAFGSEPIATRLTIGDARVLVTTESPYRRKIMPIRARLPALRHVLLVREDAGGEPLPGTEDLAQLLAAASERNSNR